MNPYDKIAARGRSGFTLTEVLISMVILVLVLAGAMSLYIVYLRGGVITALARDSASNASMAMERMVYGTGTNGGLRAAQQSTVSVTYPAGGWQLNYNGNRVLRFTPTTQRITDQAANILCENVIDSSMSFLTNGCAISLTVRETGGGRSATNNLISYVEFRN